jgi:protein-disulfide isomerase
MRHISLALLAAVTLAGWSQAAPSSEEVAEYIKKNPNIILDVLKENKKAVFDIVNSAAQEEQARRQKEEEEKEKREFEESFKNPKVPEITKKTRVRGNRDAKFTLVEYSDFQCPYCSRGYQNVEQLRKKYGANLKFVYKHLPLSFHPQAMPAAQYMEAVAMQSPDKAWQFHDKLFENQAKLSEEFYKEVAKELGLDVAKVEKDAKSAAVKQKIDADVQEAQKFGFSGTPGFLLNGVPVKGAYPVEHFDGIIAKLDTRGDSEAKKP